MTTHRLISIMCIEAKDGFVCLILFDLLCTHDVCVCENVEEDREDCAASFSHMVEPEF